MVILAIRQPHHTIELDHACMLLCENMFTTGKTRYPSCPTERTKKWHMHSFLYFRKSRVTLDNKSRENIFEHACNSKFMSNEKMIDINI
jgi:hypothetical protein